MFVEKEQKIFLSFVETERKKRPKGRHRSLDEKDTNLVFKG